MDNKKMYVDMLYKYAGLFEEVFDKDIEIMERDNWEDYEAVIKKLNFLTGRYDRNTYIEKFEEIRNELPY